MTIKKLNKNNYSEDKIMKLSVEGYVPAKRLGMREGLRAIKNAGFDCVDMSYYWQPEDSELLSDGYVEYAKELRAYLDGIGLECNQAHAPFTVKHGEALDVSNPSYLAIVRAMESASILGAKHIVVHSISQKGEDGATVFDREYNLNYYKSFQPYCERFGIRVAVENLWILDNKRQCYKGTFKSAEEFALFVKELDPSCFVACVDVGHAAMVGGEAEDYITEVGGEVLKCLHVQDGDYRTDVHTLPYLGKFNWSAIMKALKQIGYDGELTFEIVRYLKYIPNELMPDALCFAEKVGRRLISEYEQA